MSTDRRQLLKLLASGTASAALSGSISKALEIPANRRTGTIDDVEHIVILTQENRSFDQYFGTLRGVRGFSDPRAMRLPSGKTVFHQPTGSGELLPFRPNMPNLGMAFIEDVAHDWNTSHAAWNNGKYDQWVPSKGTTSMTYYTRHDLPFHYALADAFTVCDAYYCSVLGPTDPNRYHIFTGWLGNNGQGGGPVVDNAEVGYDWPGYPESLQAAGLSWKVYQDVGNGLDAAGYWGWTSNPFIGNYGDNSLLYLHQYQNAAPGSPLYEGARTGTDVLVKGTLFDEIRRDVLADKLPQVSWIAAPEAFTEHPNWPPDYGAWYTSQILDALTSNPRVWSKTVLFLMYDENGGFFDHMVPPSPPASRAEGLSNVETADEIFPGSATYQAGPYGLGVRVPMIVISPWTKGGWVNSQVFDHTSLIQFIEARFKKEHPEVVSPNITPWRRAVAGDLTSAFDFGAASHVNVYLPSTSSYKPADMVRHASLKPVPPTAQTMPTQEEGLRRARPLPYEMHVRARANRSEDSLTIHFGNRGTAAVVYQVRSGNDEKGPWTYTVAPEEHLSDTWSFKGFGQSEYDLSVYGPSGFLRSYKGSFASDENASLEVTTRYEGERQAIVLEITNTGAEGVSVRLRDRYTGERSHHHIHRGESIVKWAGLEDSFGWYDYVLTVPSDPGFKQQFAGHVENGRESMSDPAIGRVRIEEREEEEQPA